MLSDISRLVTTSLLTDSQVACSGGRDTARAECHNHIIAAVFCCRITTNCSHRRMP